MRVTSVITGTSRIALILLSGIICLALWWQVASSEGPLSNLSPRNFGHALQHRSPHPNQFPLSPASCPPISKSDSAEAGGVPSTCELCVAEPTNPLCVYGLESVRLSRSFEGSGHRMRKFLEKAIRGEEVKIGVIGASVTTGHGLRPGDQKWHDRFFEDFVKVFPKAKMFDGSSPGMNSAFYSYCFEAQLPRDMDLYIIELDINNEMKDETFNADDHLFRGLLSLPQEPAVMRVSVFALAFADLARGLVSSLFMSQFFDIPIVGIRNFMLPHLIRHPDDAGTFFSKDWKKDVDLRHIGNPSHRALGDMLAIYMREKTCDTRRRLKTPDPPVPAPWPQPEENGAIPRLHAWLPYSTDFVADPVTPLCFFLGSDTRQLTPIADRQRGNWRTEEWNGKSALTSSDVGATISFEFEGTKAGVFVWENNGAGNVVKPGRAVCWIDNHRNWWKLVDAFSEGASSTAWHVIGEGFEYGKHNISCEIIPESSTDGHDFRVMGVASQ